MILASSNCSVLPAVPLPDLPWWPDRLWRDAARDSLVLSGHDGTKGGRWLHRHDHGYSFRPTASVRDRFHETK